MAEPEPELDEPQEQEEVLAVDDQDEALGPLVSLLEALGYRVHQARNGKEAIVVFRGNPAIRRVVSDQRMGGGELNGDALHKAIATEIALRGGKFVLCSGYLGSDAVVDYITTHRIRVLNKPYTLEELQCAIALPPPCPDGSSPTSTGLVTCG